jgi:transposase
MKKCTHVDSKAATLREQGCLNPSPQDVTDELFRTGDFFDARDRLQVKYEMLRRVRIEGEAVSKTAKSFGFSRPSYYQARASFDRGGLAGMVPKKKGPRRGHKLSDEVMDYIEEARRQQESLRASALAQLVEKHFGLRVHPRSVERALRRREKKRP